jgi:drug/metabolite transporter (DMT)-like permease
LGHYRPGGAIVDEHTSLSPLQTSFRRLAIAVLPLGWHALLHLGLIVSGLAYGLYFSAARSLPSTHLTILTLLEPLVATLIATAAFGETLTIGAIVGGVLMLGAVAALRPPQTTPASAPAPAPA